MFQRNTGHLITDVSPGREVINLEIKPDDTSSDLIIGNSAVMDQEPQSNKEYYSTITSGAQAIAHANRLSGV